MTQDPTMSGREQTPEEYAAGVQAKIDAIEVEIGNVQTRRKSLDADVRRFRDLLAEWKALLPRKRGAKKAK